MRVDASQVTTLDELSSNQEEAYTKVILHFRHVINTTEGSIILRSPSGNTDIMIIAISLFVRSKHALVDYENDKIREGVWLG